MNAIPARPLLRQLEPVDDLLVLTGPPTALKGQLTLRNTGESPLFVRSLELSPGAKGKTSGWARRDLDVDLHLEPGQTGSRGLRVSLDRSVPPGDYEARITVGEREQTVRLLVQARLEVELDPDSLHLVGTQPGEVHEACVIFRNLGNIPLEIPALRHTTTLDMDLVCRNLSLALREKEQDTLATIDFFVRGLKRDLAGWVELDVREAGQIVPAGESLLLHLMFTLPRDLETGRMYEGEIRIFDQILSYTLTPAPKSPTEPKPPAPKAASASKPSRATATRSRRKRHE